MLEYVRFGAWGMTFLGEISKQKLIGNWGICHCHMTQQNRNKLKLASQGCHLL